MHTACSTDAGMIGNRLGPKLRQIVIAGHSPEPALWTHK
ncbi:MAG: hypothetical protein HWE39_03535 [Oceanospirillaceae bacterium]|nr:hypothetical protein [Oceanospirillaceae bacterium]